jgi:hypothetical protein
MTMLAVPDEQLVTPLALADARLVTTMVALRRLGWTEAGVRARLAAGRWRRYGCALVRHNGPLSLHQQWAVARLHGGPGALLTAFTAAQAYGLQRWEREDVHILVQAGSRMRNGCPVATRVHYVPRLVVADAAAGSVVHRLPDALLRAAATFGTPRPGCGLLAAAVQQRVAQADELASALERAPRQRHRRELRLAVADIAQGADALSEIDFVRLCRAHRLPPPAQQVARIDSAGRRRYLDATWRRRDGRLVVVEVDGALHLVATRWWDDQLRQNELALADALVLRFPSVIVRSEPALVAAHLRRALLLES